MNDIIKLGEALGPLANLIAVGVALVGAVGFVIKTLRHKRALEQQIADDAKAVGQRLRANIANADSALGWHAAMAYAQYYLSSKSHDVIAEQNEIIVRMLSGVILSALLVWQSLAVAGGVVIGATLILIGIDWWFLGRMKQRYHFAEHELGMAWADQMDRMRVPLPPVKPDDSGDRQSGRDGSG